MPPVDVPALEILRAIRDRGSISSAATAVGITQAAASRRLGLLERRLRLSLVTRTAGGSTLTSAGLALCAAADPLFRALDQVQAVTDELVVGEQLTLSVAASRTVADAVLPRWLARVSGQGPIPTFSVAVMNSAEVLDAVRAGRVQLGFVETPGELAGVEARHLGPDEVVILVTADHPWARRSKVTREEVAARPLVVREHGSGTRETLVRWLGAEPQVALEADSTDALVAACRAGIGPAVVSRRSVTAELADRTLTPVRIDGRLMRPFRAVWRSGERLSTVATSLLEHATAAAE